MEIRIPRQLVVACECDPERAAWLASVPEKVKALGERWGLHLGPPFEAASCAWVSPVRQNGRDAVLKLGVPHMEGAHEILALQFWDGDPSVRLFDSD